MNDVNDFEKDFKLMIISVYEKTMENLQKKKKKNAEDF